MTNLIKQQNDQPQDVKTIRHTLLQYIKERLRKAEGGEGGNIRGVHLFLATSGEEKHLYEAAVYYHDEDRFKKEVQKIADDFAIALPDNWTMKIVFTDELPQEAVKINGVAAALRVSTTKEPVLKKFPDAYITILSGEAEQELYTIKPNNSKVYIGRDKKVQTADGFFRENTIAFTAASTHESNKFISRQHAHIEWNNETGTFFLFADEGGIPPRNKVKIKQQDGALLKLQNAHIGHQLQEGDQVVLGESALIRFSYIETAD